MKVFTEKQINSIKRSFYNKYKRYTNLYVHHKIDVHEISDKFSNMLNTVQTLNIKVDKYVVQDMMFYIQTSCVISQIINN